MVLFIFFILNSPIHSRLFVGCRRSNINISAAHLISSIYCFLAKQYMIVFKDDGVKEW
jgi:hypothetical protein